MNSVFRDNANVANSPESFTNSSRISSSNITMNYDQTLNFTKQVLQRLGWDGDKLNLTRFGEIYEDFDMPNDQMNMTVMKPFVTTVVYDQ